MKNIELIKEKLPQMEMQNIAVNKATQLFNKQQWKRNPIYKICKY